MTNFPNGHEFAFTVFDDTDNGTMGRIEPVYRFLEEQGFRTTKSTWVYPSRGKQKAESFASQEYVHFLHHLRDVGFEIGLHGVGEGRFTREEIIEGFEIFQTTLGFYPSIHTNHLSNEDNLYWGVDRFTSPVLRLIYNLVNTARGRRVRMAGNHPASDLFWGDLAKEHLKYIRNYTFNGINTLCYDPRMPYAVERKSAHSNCWFSSSDGHTLPEFNALVSKGNVDHLVESKGVCIVYTHFASKFVNEKGDLDPTFRQNMSYLASKNGWFAPVGTILDFLAEKNGVEDPGTFYLTTREIRWLVDRIVKKIKTRR